MRLGEQPVIQATADVQRSRLGRYVEIGERTSVVESTFGDYSYVVNDSEIAYTEIGKFCSIAAHARINPGNHPYWRASQGHFTYRASQYFDREKDESAFFGWRRANPVTIGHDVWIGHGAIVLPTVMAGSGAIVGAGAVVTPPVAPYTIVAGVPAKPIRDRFPLPEAERLQSIAWWDWDHERLRLALPDFRDLSVEEFIEKHSAASD